MSSLCPPSAISVIESSGASEKERKGEKKEEDLRWMTICSVYSESKMFHLNSILIVNQQIVIDRSESVINSISYRIFYIFLFLSYHVLSYAPNLRAEPPEMEILKRVVKEETRLYFLRACKKVGRKFGRPSE